MSLSYSEKLKDPRWQQKRLRVFERDGFKCIRCGDDKKTLHVHHCYYSNETSADPWDYPLESLLTFCCDCHDDAHAMDADMHEQSVVEVLKFRGFSVFDFVQLHGAIGAEVFVAELRVLMKKYGGKS